jgi:DNA-binding NarL/FixJ family response regulator
MDSINILLADDHALIRAGLRTLLSSLGYRVVAEASNGNEALKLIELHVPDIVLMDIAMPGMSGLEATRRVRQEFPTVRVIILSMFANAEYARQALHAGAAGYLLKNSRIAEVEIAINAAMQGETYLSPAVAKFIAADYSRRGSGETSALERLTPRQLEILQMIAEGLSRKEVADKLSISVKTFDTYRAQLMKQLDIHDTASLVRFAIQMGLVIPKE